MKNAQIKLDNGRKRREKPDRVKNLKTKECKNTVKTIERKRENMRIKRKKKKYRDFQLTWWVRELHVS